MKVFTLLCCLMLFTGTIHGGGAPRGAPVVNEVLATQVALDRSGFSPGEIDGRAGRNLQRALAAFQGSHQLPATGRIDDQTWKQLSAAGGDVPPLMDYTITDADVAGPFMRDIPPKLPDQATLDALNYRTPLEALGERFHSSPALLQQLNPGATFDHAGEHLMVPNVNSSSGSASSAAAPSPTSDITVFVTKSTSALTIEDPSGHVLFHAPVTSGSIHDPLPIGTWKVNGVQRNPQFHYNPQLFWDAKAADGKAKIPPGPNNPIGVVWIDLDLEHYGIHGTPEPGNIGHTESHGCVRLTNWDAMRVASMVQPGTPVQFR